MLGPLVVGVLDFLVVGMLDPLVVGMRDPLGVGIFGPLFGTQCSQLVVSGIEEVVGIHHQYYVEIVLVVPCMPPVFVLVVGTLDTGGYWWLH